ncbi:unnamed protein product, partial [Rotaria magnacalcarata]
MNSRCLFCTQRAVTFCCSGCRTRDRSIMFETLLTLLGKASITNSYYDQIKAICQQIETLEWLLTPIQFTPVAHFDSEIHKVAADGNCLYNSIMCLSGSTALTPSELRVRTLNELVKNEIFYNNRFMHIIGPLNEAMKNVARNFAFSELYEIAALSNVLKCNIRSNSQSQNHLAQPKISGSGSTPTKATTKNNSLTQVRIPQFNQEDDETRSFQVPSTVIMTTNEIITPRTKRRLQLAETCASVESTIVEQKRIQARERMAAKRAAATPEEAERQRTLARERSAARRAAAIPEEAERQRTLARESRAAVTTDEAERQRILARERSAVRRAAATPEEADRQRILARERSAARRAAAIPEEADRQRILARERRAAATPDEAERQRMLARERSASRRAALTQEKAEQQRTLARDRSAARRALLTSEEVEQQRSIDREIHAARRGALTPKEVEQQRTLAVDRSMAKRATATPIEAEEQRVLSRERTATRRAARVSEEAKQQQTVAYKTARLQKTVKQKQTVMKRKPNQDAKVDWPKPVDMDCK